MKTVGYKRSRNGKNYYMSESTEERFRVCRVCGKTKPLEDYYFRKENNSYRTECKQCAIAKARLRNTGWSPEEYERQWCIQEGKCAICGCTLNSSRYTKASADHDHKTGKLRGILCCNCNTAIGLMKENPYRLECAIRYLEEHNNN